MKIIIVEDDPVIAADLETIITDAGFSVIGINHDPITAKKDIEIKKPDLVLLDINLNHELDGIDLATLIHQSAISYMFITAFTDQQTLNRLKGLNPLGYVIKPFNEKDIVVALTLAKNQMHSDLPVSVVNDKLKSKEDFIFVKTKNNSTVKINFNDVLFLEAYDNYSFIHTAKEKHLVNYTLKELEHKINETGFARVHRSYIVNVIHVEAIKDGDLIIKNHVIPIGKSYKDDVNKRFPVL